MKFGWINLFGAGIVVLMLLPNIVYAIKNKDEKNLCANRAMNLPEQIGRYACIVLMWLPLLVWEFGFSSEPGMMLYFIGNGALLLAYWLVFIRHLKHKSRKSALILAVLPAGIFLLSGLTLRHWLLVGFAALFAVSHVYVTICNTSPLRAENREEKE